MKQGKFLMGNSVLSRLWNQYPDNMDACSAPERDFLPQMDDYFAGNLLKGIDNKTVRRLGISIWLHTLDSGIEIGPTFVSFGFFQALLPY